MPVVRLGIVRRANPDAPAEFVPGAPALRAIPFSSQGDPEESEDSSGKSPDLLPESRDKVLEMLAAAKALEVEQAQRKLEAGQPLKATERKLLERTFRAEPKDEGESSAAFVESVSEKMEAYWVNGARGVFQVRDGGSQWLEVQREDLHAMLLARGISEERVGRSRVKQFQECVTHILKNRTLDRAFDGLAGFRPGIHDFKSVRVLVRKGPITLTPKPGDWNTIHELIAGALVLDDLPAGDRRAWVQYHRFLYWMKQAATNVQQPGPYNMNSQVMILAGSAGSGKSRLQHLVITPMLGDRSADPQLYLFGDTTFNEGWMGCEHLLIEDPKPQAKTYDKLAFAQKLKALAVNQQHNFHAKGKGEFAVPTRFVVSISINDDPDALRMLPKLTPDFAEKVMLLKVRHYPPPMPTETTEEKAALEAAVRAEMPAFLDHLLNLPVPTELKDPKQRFGSLFYHNPELALGLSEDSAESELLSLLDYSSIKATNSYDPERPLWKTDAGWNAREYLERHPTLSAPLPRLLLTTCAESRRRVWIGTAQELTDTMERCTSHRAWEKIVKNNQISRLLSRLAEDKPDRVCSYRGRPEGHHSPVRLWLIAADYAEEEEAAQCATADDVGF